MGTKAQQKKFLPLLLESKPARVTAAVIEPLINFDLSELTCQAKKKGAGYALSGKKCLVPLGTSAEKSLVYAALEGKPGYENVGGFIVERGQSGLTVAGRERNMGLAALDTVELELKDVEVGGEAVLAGGRAASSAN